jgi:hypothetical protein
VPADRLLVFEVSHGWRPLRDFLDVPVPDEPFPRKNGPAAFTTRLASTDSPRSTGRPAPPASAR